ncbi:carboxypeptidase D-like [Glandiceps talaboti]
MHGNEVIGREILLHFAEYLLSNYGVDDDITKFVDNTRIHILPTMNPDGFERSFVGICQGIIGRYNNDGYDLNRNFPDAFEINEAPIQVEADAMISWLESIPFVLSANYHGGALVANYPMDNLTPEDKAIEPVQYSKSPDDDVYRNLSLIYSYSHTRMHVFNETKCIDVYGEAGAFEGFEDGITNGAAWYWTIGSMQDYNYVYHGCMEITLEISCCKHPEEDRLEDYWEENKNAMLEYLKQVHRGIKGIVMDENQNPISRARVTVKGRPNFYNTTIDGEYFKILMPGTYDVEAAADGYTTEEMSLTVRDHLYDVTEFNFILSTLPPEDESSVAAKEGCSVIVLLSLVLSCITLN